MHPPPFADDASQARKDAKRERDVHLLYGAAFREIPHLDARSRVHRTPRPSLDSTLTALCQLTAIRLGAQRCILSLFDGQRQHVLAEATGHQSLRPNASPSTSLDLWYGNVSIPRSWGWCDQVLDLDQVADENPILFINDLAESDIFTRRKDALRNPDMRFYASTPLFSPSGTIVGALSIFDSKSWDGLSKDQSALFRDLSSTVVNYLHTYTVKDEYQRGELFTRGLRSFAEGASTLNPSDSSLGHSTSPSTACPDLSSGTSSSVDSAYVSAQEPGKLGHINSVPKIHGPLVELPHSASSVSTETSRAKSARHRSIRTLQDSILPSNSKAMFSRAANVLMASSDLDGALIFDASVVAKGQRRASGDSGTGTEPSSEPYNSKESSSDEGSSRGSDGSRMGHQLTSSSSKMCQILGAATSESSTSDHGTLLEIDLARLLREYPDGRIFNFDAEGHSVSSTEETSGQSPSDTNSERSETSQSELDRKRTRGAKSGRGSTAIRAMFPNARSVAFIPFWDYERSRWFAGCLCWSNNLSRLLSPSVDLTYFKIFSHSIMRELSRLDAIASDKVKTTFVASISHELRSPLHGILGTLEFFKDTSLDSFQISMLNSLTACGTTLLDTINHVMDYAKISEPRKAVASRRLKNSNTIRLSSKPLKITRVQDPAFDFGLATEEVIEAVFAGSSFIPNATAMIDPPVTPSVEIPEFFPKRKACYIILDVDFAEDWIFSFPAGSWRRIVMNLFGNAMKYTTSGYIHVSLRAKTPPVNTSAPSAITLTVSDTGSGMSPAFLANGAFQPFSQENPHSMGTGLGLSIVRQIIDVSGGKIEASSEPSVGTRLTVKLSVPRPEKVQDESPQRAQFLTTLPRLKGRRVCILHPEEVPSSEDSQSSRIAEGRSRFTTALVKCLEHQLHMEVIQTKEWTGHDAEIVILPEPSFTYLASIRRSRINNKPAPVTMFIAMDAMEAATLRSDARVVNKESVVEICSQPAGPYKLAFILDSCLNRFEHPAENIEHWPSAATSPRAHPVELLPSHLSSSRFDSLSVANFSSSTNNPRAPRLSTTKASTRPSMGSSPPASIAGLSFASTAERMPTISIDDTISSKILITDDNPINRRILVAFMVKNSLQYEQAENGLEALHMYQRSPHQFSAILMDMSMPVLDGMSATAQIRQYEKSNNLPRCLIIALTGLASPSAKLEAWNSGIDHFMTKPINFKALENLLVKEEVIVKRPQLQEQGLREKTKGADRDNRKKKGDVLNSIGGEGAALFNKKAEAKIPDTRDLKDPAPEVGVSVDTKDFASVKKSDDVASDIQSSVNKEAKEGQPSGPISDQSPEPALDLHANPDSDQRPDPASDQSQDPALDLPTNPSADQTSNLKNEVT
ncbi:hypothetical protein IQ07DRAFT_682628 [Pyrenochaeta sp. DS3sAY3a]|nr:hypothetical protein IQ07DRAFT_682628 [Pyrenochaeta sp. DS3sAY3a]